MNLFRPIHHARSAQEAAHQIEALILEGVLKGGDRLPAERELAIEMDVSRPILREAIKGLEAAGLLESRHGGGTFVADVIGTVFAPPVAQLLSSHARATRDFLEYRREVEGVTARLAADRATADDLALLGEAMARMEAANAAGDAPSEARADIEFHALIGEMAHNLVLLHTLRSCYRLLADGVFRNRDRLYSLPDGRTRLLEQHRAIYEAIVAGNGAAAETAARSHIEYIIAATQDLERRTDRERIAGLRLAMREDKEARTPMRKRKSQA